MPVAGRLPSQSDRDLSGQPSRQDLAPAIHRPAFVGRGGRVRGEARADLGKRGPFTRPVRQGRGAVKARRRPKEHRLGRWDQSRSAGAHGLGGRDWGALEGTQVMRRRGWVHPLQGSRWGAGTGARWLQGSSWGAGTGAHWLEGSSWGAGTGARWLEGAGAGARRLGARVGRAPARALQLGRTDQGRPLRQAAPRRTKAPLGEAVCAAAV